MDFVALELIKALQKIDKENTYFIFVNTGPDRCLSETKNFRIIEFSGWYPVWEQLKLPAKSRRYKIDILHCTSNVAALGINVPLVVTIHDIIYMEGSMLLKKGFTPYQRFGNLYRRILVGRILKKARTLVTVSQCEKSLLLKLPGVNKDKVEVVYNAVGDHFKKEISQEEKARVKHKYHLPDDYVMFLGNTDPKKNARNTLLGFIHFCETSSSDIMLVVADMDEKRAHTFLAETGKEAFISRMVFPGYITNEDMPALIRQAKIFLYPSKRESFGIPILEAMACEVPVVTSNVFSMPEIAGEAAILVDPASVESIGEGIAALDSNEQLRHEMIKKGQERLKHFSWEKSAADILEIYTN